MSYTVKRIATIDPVTFRRIFNDCESRLEENFAVLQGKSSDEKYNYLLEAAQAWAKIGMCLECSKDGLPVFISYGELDGTNWKIMNFLAGRDASGSRSYLYDSGWLVAMRDFHLTMSSVYTTQEHIMTPDSSAKTFVDARIDVADSDNRFNHTVESENTVADIYIEKTIKDIS
jgi:hypothetical protein